jgi:hypothetical protein
MTGAALADLHRAYIACLNKQDWSDLHKFVAADAHEKRSAVRSRRLPRDARARLQGDPGPSVQHRTFDLRTAARGEQTGYLRRDRVLPIP